MLQINTILTDVDTSAAESYNTADEVFILDNGQFLIPGFIDCHTHAVQFPNLGIGYDRSLLDWLETYTFPLEKKYSDVNFATRVFEASVVREIILLSRTKVKYHIVAVHIVKNFITETNYQRGHNDSVLLCILVR